MGDAKDQLTPKTSGAKNAFAKLLGRKNPVDKTVKTTEETVADNLVELESALVKLVAGKESDFKNEKGSERYNAIQLSRLKTIHHHIEQAISVAADYGQEKH